MARPQTLRASAPLRQTAASIGLPGSSGSWRLPPSSLLQKDTWRAGLPDQDPAAGHHHRPVGTGNSGIVELGDEVAVDCANGYTQRFLVASPIEASLDDLNISVESPLGQALVGRRVGEQVEVDAPDGRFRCHILTTGRHQTATASRPRE